MGLTLLGEALDKAQGRLQGAIEAGKGGDLTLVPPTAAGSDLDGRELMAHIEGFSVATMRVVAQELTDWGYTEEGGEVDLVQLAVEIRALVQRHVNGTALCWFWSGYEGRRMQEEASRAPCSVDDWELAVELLREWVQGQDPEKEAVGYRTGAFLRGLES